jgi:hypothetical protein
LRIARAFASRLSAGRSSIRFVKGLLPSPLRMGRGPRPGAAFETFDPPSV